MKLRLISNIIFLFLFIGCGGNEFSLKPYSLSTTDAGLDADADANADSDTVDSMPDDVYTEEPSTDSHQDTGTDTQSENDSAVDAAEEENVFDATEEDVDVVDSFDALTDAQDEQASDAEADEGAADSADDNTDALDAAEEDSNVIIFDPPTTNMELWLRADSISDSTVSVWPDKSPKNRQVFQNNTSQKPTKIINSLNGKSTIRFDGQNDCLQLPDNYYSLNNGVSIFAALKLNQNFYLEKIIEFSTSTCENTILLENVPNTTLVMYYSINAKDCSSTNFSSSNYLAYEFMMLEVVQELGGNTTVYINSNKISETILPDPVLANRLVNAIGADPGCAHHFLDGNIAELIVYSSALNDSDRKSIEYYMNDYWKLW